MLFGPVMVSGGDDGDDKRGECDPYLLIGQRLGLGLGHGLRLWRFSSASSTFFFAFSARTAAFCAFRASSAAFASSF